MSEVWYLKHIRDQEKMIKDLNGEVEELKEKARKKRGGRRNRSFTKIERSQETKISGL